MKKLFILATAAVALASCSDSDLVGNIASSQQTEQPQAVEFGTYMGTAATRATGGAVGDITTTELKKSTHGFGVVAYHTNTVDWAGDGNTVIPNFMWNQKVTYDGTTNNYWTYSPVKYWPNDFSTGNVDNKEGKAGEETAAWGSQNGGKVSFFAYAPYVQFATSSADYKSKTASQQSSPATDGITAITANSVAKEPQVYYILNNADVDQAVDLLWGLRGNSSGYQKADGTKDSHTDYNVNLTKQSVAENVNFLFKHALAKVGGHTPNNPAEAYQTGLQVVLDVDKGSLEEGEKAGSEIVGGTLGKGTLVTVEKIEIYDKATASATPVNPIIYSPAQSTNLVSEGWFNIATGVWDLDETGSVITNAKYSSVVDNTNTVAGNHYALNAQIKEGTPTAETTGSPATFSKWKISGTEVSGVTTSPQDVYTNDSDVPSLMLIPAPDNDQTLVVRIKYIVRTWDPNLAATGTGSSTEGTWTKVTQTITNEVTIPKGSLQSNKYYKLLIHLGLTSVKFTASVVDWEEAGASSESGTDNDDANYDKDIYLPSNTITASTTIANTETVSAATVSVGNIKIYSVPAAAGAFTITLNGIANTNTTATVTAVATGADAAVNPTVTYSDAATTGTVSINLTANTSTTETRTTTLTIKTKDGSDTVVTLVQIPAAS